jgi:hypothetical protein
MTATILLVLLLAGIAGVWLHHLFEGEWLPYDLLREWRLSGKSLAALDDRWAATSNRSEIVISLTTTPSRIGLIEHTLKSLLDQTRMPGRIVLNIPAFSQREQVPYVVPEALTRLQSVHIQRSDDLGPATKLIPTLDAQPPDTPILVVDDDRIYPDWLVRHYERAAAAQPDRALTLSGWVAPKNLIDAQTTILGNLLMRPPTPIRGTRLRTPRRIDVMQGVMSYLVRPRFFDLDEVAQFTGPQELCYVDDVRTSALCKVEKWVIPAPSLSFVPKRHGAKLQVNRLGLVNRLPGEPQNRNNTIALQYFADRWTVGGPGH